MQVVAMPTDAPAASHTTVVCMASSGNIEGISIGVTENQLTASRRQNENDRALLALERALICRSKK